MKRRNFIKSVPAFALPAMIGGFEIKALSPSHWLSVLAGMNTETDHVMVMVQLNGGNDGLNTVIPLDQYTNLSAARSNILIPDTKVLKLSGYDATGLHPSMTGLQGMFNNGEVTIVQGVGYPKFNYSHFRATDIWLTGSDSDEILESGWLARYLNGEYPNFPVGYPNDIMPDPLAIQIGSGGLLPLYQAAGVSYGITLANTNDDITIGSSFDDPKPMDWAGKELAFIREVQRQADKYGDVILAASGKVPVQSTYPDNNNLAAQLKIVARLIAGGLKTRIYHVTLGGFDTHSNQAAANDTTTGTHANLLKTLSDALAAFTQDLKFLNVNDRVSGMVFSEFGRRIKSNASGGTDHGSSLPAIFFGAGLQPGIIGNNPVIPSNASANTNLEMQHDFRTLYAAVLRDWFCVPEAELPAIQLGTYEALPVFTQTNDCQLTATHEGKTAGVSLLDIYPNPAYGEIHVNYVVQNDPVTLEILSMDGRQVKRIQTGQEQSGNYTVETDVSGLSGGIYFLKYSAGNQLQVKPFVKAR